MTSSLIIPIDNNIININHDSNLTNEEIKEKLYINGPIAVSINTTNLFKNIGEKSIITNENIENEPDHAVLLVGYEYDENESKYYWICKNSWGNNWNINGFFAVYFSNDIIFFELMSIETLDINIINNYNQTYENNNPNFELNFNNLSTLINKNINHSLLSKGYNRLYFKKKKNKIPKNKIINSNYNIPKTLTWYNNNNYLNKSIIGQVLDQKKCGCCWLFASIQMLSSKIYMEKNTDYFIQLSIQSILNSILTSNESCIIYQENNLILESVYTKNEYCNGGNFLFFDVLLNGIIELEDNTKLKINGNNFKGLGMYPYNQCEYGNNIENCSYTKISNEKQSDIIPNEIYPNYENYNFWIIICVIIILIILCIYIIYEIIKM